MRKIFVAVSALLLLSACDPFEGVLSVKEAFKVKIKDDKKFVEVTLPAGDLNAKFHFPSKTEIKIETKINGKKKTLNLILPKKLAIPANGNFSIAAADLGQEFGADGTTVTRVSDGGISTDYESCTYQRRETRCHVDNKGNTICRDYWVTVHGRRFVEYQIRHTDKSINVSFGRDANILATFAGAKSYSERLIRHQGHCF